jgi:hypothetical protein
LNQDYTTLLTQFEIRRLRFLEKKNMNGKFVRKIVLDRDAGKMRGYLRKISWIAHPAVDALYASA